MRGGQVDLPAVTRCKGGGFQRWETRYLMPSHRRLPALCRSVSTRFNLVDKLMDLPEKRGHESIAWCPGI